MAQLIEVTGWVPHTVRAMISTALTRWQACFNVNPPPRVHTELLRRVLAWHVQVEATGQKGRIQT